VSELAADWRELINGTVSVACWLRSSHGKHARRLSSQPRDEADPFDVALSRVNEVHASVNTGALVYMKYEVYTIRKKSYQLSKVAPLLMTREIHTIYYC